MKDKPTKELIQIATLLEKIDQLDKLISKDVSEYVKSVKHSPVFPFTENEDGTLTVTTKKAVKVTVNQKARERANAAHELLIDAAERFANE